MPLNEETKLLEKRIGVATQQAKKLGCRDPFINRLWLRFFHLTYEDGPSRSAPGDLWRSTQELEQSAYPSVRKLHACLQTLGRYEELRETPPEIQTLFESAVKYLKEVIPDAAIPDDDLYSFCSELLAASKPAQRDIAATWTELEPLVSQRLKSTRYPDLLKGFVYWKWAWSARGSGWVSQVSEEGWKLMHERLVVARTSLERAWRMDQNDCRPANLMIEVVLLDGSGHSEMETWFRRAMAANTNNFSACTSKLNYLTPRWGGSTSALIAFGRECLTNTAWGPSIPMILPMAHREAGTEIVENRTELYYRQRPEVWQDGRAAFEELLRRNPGNKTYRKEYAEWAILCNKMDLAMKLMNE